MKISSDTMALAESRDNGDIYPLFHEKEEAVLWTWASS
jgi:hypothetical protein